MSLASNDNALRRGLGKIRPIASVYNVYRLGGASGTPNGASSIINSANLVTDNFNARIVRETSRKLLEQEEIYKQFYIGECDVRSLKIGDCLVETAPILTDAPDGRAFTLVDVQPMMPAIFARTEIMGSISRFNSADKTDEPILGVDTYQGTTKLNEWVLVLTNGSYDFVSSGIAAVVPFGIQPSIRIGTAQEFKYPTATKRSLHYAYIPLLPGAMLQPGDVLMAQNGDRFRIENLSVFTVGIQGYLATCESLFV